MIEQAHQRDTALPFAITQRPELCLDPLPIARKVVLPTLQRLFLLRNLAEQLVELLLRAVQGGRANDQSKTGVVRTAGGLK
ncbi:hypothetical protein [Rhodanobacter sp. BL-MT-08]